MEESGKQIMLLSSKEELEKLFYEFASLVGKKFSAPKWIHDNEAAELLGISRFTLNEWRQKGKIEFTQSSERIFLYSREWIETYLNKNAKKAFK